MTRRFSILVLLTAAALFFLPAFASQGQARRCCCMMAGQDAGKSAAKDSCANGCATPRPKKHCPCGEAPGRGKGCGKCDCPCMNPAKPGQPPAATQVRAPRANPRQESVAAPSPDFAVFSGSDHPLMAALAMRPGGTGPPLYLLNRVLRN